MNNINIKLHYYQKELLKSLSKTNSLRFNELLIEGLESEHMNYHLKKLIEIQLVRKEKGKYVLTDAGKDYFNLMDEETDFIEKQPKTSIIIHGVRESTKKEVEHLLVRRLRQPYYGKVGRVTGKVKFGETLKGAAARELLEETGLKANTFKLEEIYHKLRKRKDGTWVQDVIFYIFFVTDFSGTFIAKTLYQENFWMTKNEFEKAHLDSYRNLKLDNRINPKKLTVKENVNYAKGF